MPRKRTAPPTKRPLAAGECGTPRGYRWHMKQGEETCQECRDAIAAYQRKRYGEALGTHPSRKLQPCGTDAAYNRHIQHGEEPCAVCRAAHNAYARVDRRTRRILAAMAQEAA